MKDGCTGKNSKKKRSIPLPVLKSGSPQKGGIKDSVTARWRAGALIALNVLMVLHIMQWRFYGSTVSPIEPSEAMFTIQNGAVNAGFIFFSLAILATLIFGRFVCGWGCHILALQDLCGWLLKKMGLTPKPFRSRLLVYVPLSFALYMFVWPTVFKFFAATVSEPLIPQFTNHLITTEFWATFPPVAVAIPFLFICGFMTVYFLGQKGFCTYGCPYGGFFSLADKFAPGKIRVTDACNQCGHCTATCTSNVLVHAEVKEYGMVVDQGCMKCMDCISVCPNDALYFGFGKPSFTVAKTITKNYSMTLAEDIASGIVFFASLVAVWNVYQLVPMLMAIGIATVSTFLAFKTWRLFHSENLTFHKYTLKTSGKIKKIGLVFLSFAIIWLALNAHSGMVHYYEYQAKISFEKIGIPDELALAQTNADQWLSPEDRKNVNDGRYYFQTASRLSLFVNKEALSKLAWVEYLFGDTNQAIILLGKAADNQYGQGKAISLYYKGAILNRLGRYQEASTSLDQALAERPDLVMASEERGVSLWQRGQKQDAVAAWREALRQNPGLPLANLFLAGAEAELGNADSSVDFEKLADQYIPADPRFHWMLGLRLQNVGMKAIADKHFLRAVQLNPAFRSRRKDTKD